MKEIWAREHGMSCGFRTIRKTLKKREMYLKMKNSQHPQISVENDFGRV
jgi:hypothetical protein